MACSRVLVVWNKVSGQDTQEEDRKIVLSFLQEKNVEFDIRDWTDPHQIPRWVEEAEKNGTDLIISAGGDGTAVAIADSLIRGKSSINLGVLPLGTSNLLALSLGLPPGLEDALEDIWNGKKSCIDAGYVREKDSYFLVGASIGAHAEVVRRTSREMKRKMGFFAYLLAAVRTLLGHSSRKVTIKSDRGSWRWKTDSIEVMNTTGFLAAEDSLVPHVDPGDGLLDLIALRLATVLDMAGMLLHALRGRKFRPRWTEHRQIRTLSIQPSKPMELQLDGETMGKTPATIEVQKSVLTVMVPEQSTP